MGWILTSLFRRKREIAPSRFGYKFVLLLENLFGTNKDILPIKVFISNKLFSILKGLRVRVFNALTQCHSFSVTLMMFAIMQVEMTNRIGFQPTKLFQ